MNIRTIEADYDYRMKYVMETFLNQNEELKGLNAEELQDAIYESKYAVDFARLVLQDMYDWSGDELFIQEDYI
jgi:hypothetical protein